jgi:flavin reductase (DIM6/NTAB) family NADH-FMN oxidoreductase RutF
MTSSSRAVVQDEPGVPAVLVEEFKAAMRGVATTVTVITLRAGAANHGMTATAVMSVCIAPPSLLIAVNEAASIHEPLLSASRFCINVLQRDQRPLSELFSSRARAVERFGPGTWSLDDEVPYLLNSQASLFCRRVACWPHGTHTLCMGEVYRAVVAARAPDPLVYMNQSYLNVR